MTLPVGIAGRLGPALRILLRGMGQIMLQRNAATGALFTLGLAIAAPEVALAAVAGALGGTLVAHAARFPHAEIEAGLYGFNAALVAIAAVVFYPAPLVALGVAAVGVVAATLLMRVMQKYALQPYTFPFVAVVWLAFAVIAPSPTTALADGSALQGFLQGFGQVMFQANSITGLVFWIAIAVCSLRTAGWAAAGAALGWGIGATFGWPGAEVAHGLYGYNAVLAAIAVQAIGARGVGVALAVLLSIAVTRVFIAAGLPALTFPFVLSTWVILAGARWWSRATARSS